MIKKAIALIIVTLLILSGMIIAQSFTLNESIKAHKNYISSNGETQFQATGYIYVTQDENGVWWFINSTGHKFFSVGIQCTEPNEFYYGDLDTWVNTTKDRLEEWGFNSINWDWEGKKIYSKDKYHYVVIKLEYYGKEAKGWKNKHTPDVFNPNWTKLAREKINETAEKVREDPNLLGYMIENEIKWGPLAPTEFDTAINDLTLLEEFMNAPKETPGKKRVVEFLRERYDNDTKDFNKVWNMEVKNFNELFNHTKFGYEGWRLVTRWPICKLKLYQQYPGLKNKRELFKRAKRDVIDFNILYAETFFNTTDTILESADPNHMNLGCRDSAFGAPKEVIEVAKKYIDVISFNYYRSYDYFIDPDQIYMQEKYGILSTKNWLSEYYKVAEKPIIITEFDFGENDDTQDKKGKRWEWYATNSFNAPYIVGFTKFPYRDRLILIDWGLVNFYNEPKEVIIKYVKDTNKKAVELHENSYQKSIFKDKIFDFNQYLTNMGLELLNNFFNQVKKTKSIDIDKSDYEYSSSNIKEKYPVIDIYVDNDSMCPGDGSKNWPYCKIQNAIDNASAGEVIYVYNGSYYENLVINKTISLIGEDRDKTIIYGTPEKNDNKIIIIQEDYVNLTGFNITSLGGVWHFNTFRETCNGIYIKNHKNCNISGNNFNKTGHYGIKALGSDDIVITNNIIKNTRHKEGCSIFLDRCNNSLVRNNFIDKCTVAGVWFSRGKESFIRDNTILNSRTIGIIIDRGYGDIIIGNAIKGNKEGIFLRDSSSITVTCNNLYNTEKDAYFLRSNDINWNGNYWGRARILPNIIMGAKGLDGQFHCMNFDWTPLKKPYND